MPAAPADKVDVEVLATEGASFERRYDLDRFARLADVIAAPGGEAVARFRFLHLAEDVPGCELSVEAEASLRCERCLEIFRQPLRSQARLAFVAGEADEGRVPDDCEAVTLGPDRASLSELVEDELLLSLPVVPLHGEGTACAAERAVAAGDAAGTAETHRPFAGLKELLKS